MKRGTEHWCNETVTEENEELEEKLVPVPFCTSQIPQGITWVRIRILAVTGRRLFAFPVAAKFDAVI